MPTAGTPEPANGWDCTQQIAAQFLWKGDGSYYPIEVMEKKANTSGVHAENSPNSKYVYYCHYIDYNRRLDEWIPSEKTKARDDQIIRSEAALAAELAQQSKRMSRQDTQVAAMLENDEHAGLDEESIREHEEATRVKNVARVELGKHDMMTWYYSPLPEEYRFCDKLYFCEWDLRFFKSKKSLLRSKFINK